MKIIHFADLHLGVENYGHIDPDTGLSSRLLDFLSALDQVIDYALNNKVDLVLFCGDVYKSREPSQTQQREFAKRVNHLTTNNIPIFLLIGNHDSPNALGLANTAEIFDTLTIKNVYVSSRPDIYRIPTNSGTIQIASLPWLRRSALLTKREFKNLSLVEINQRLQQSLTNIINNFAPKLNPKLPSLLAAHVWVSGAQLGSEKLMTIGQEHTLLLSNVAHPAFDYIALGHIHRHQILSLHPPVVYSGSLERIDFGEADDEKGFYSVEINRGEEKEIRQVSFNFHQIIGRRFLTINSNIGREDHDPTATVLKTIADQGTQIRDAIVRLSISLPGEIEGQLKDNEIRSALTEAHHFTIVKNVERRVRQRLGNWTAEGMTPLGALREYFKSKRVSPERTELLLQYGERLIKENIRQV